jgi:hypothetical protein
MLLPGFRSGLEVSKARYRSFLGPARMYQADAAIVLYPLDPASRYDAVLFHCRNMTAAGMSSIATLGRRARRRFGWLTALR